MTRERFWKPVTPEDADGRWVYELTLCESEGRPGYDVQVVRHFFGFDGLGHEIDELLHEHFMNLDDAERYYAEKRQLVENGFTESVLDS